MLKSLPTGRVTDICFSPNEKYIVSCYDKTLKIWELETGKLVKSLQGHEDEINSVKFSPNGECIISGSSDKKVKIWNMSSSN